MLLYWKKVPDIKYLLHNMLISRNGRDFLMESIRAIKNDNNEKLLPPNYEIYSIVSLTHYSGRTVFYSFKKFSITQDVVGFNCHQINKSFAFFQCHLTITCREVSKFPIAHGAVCHPPSFLLCTDIFWPLKERLLIVWVMSMQWSINKEFLLCFRKYH